MDVIKARGEMSREADAPANLADSGVKIDQVELKAGQKYQLKTDDGNFDFTAEAGGIIAGEGVNGSVQAGKIIFTAKGKEYEGQFSSPVVASC